MFKRLGFSQQAIQLTVVVLTFSWGVYTFVWREYLLPRLQPASLDITTSVEEVGAEGTDLLRITFNVSNPAVLSNHIHAGRWVLYELKRLPPGDGKGFQERLDNFLANGKAHVERASVVDRGKLLATGELFSNSNFEAGQSRQDTVVIKVPASTREVLLNTFMPYGLESASNQATPSVSYELNASAGLTPVLCRTTETCTALDSEDWNKPSFSSGLRLLFHEESFALGARPKSIRLR